MMVEEQIFSGVQPIIPEVVQVLGVREQSAKFFQLPILDILH